MNKYKLIAIFINIMIFAKFKEVTGNPTHPTPRSTPQGVRTNV